MRNIWQKGQELKVILTILLLVFLTMNLSAENARIIVEIPNVIGMSNYFGKGFPSDNFNKQKVSINNTTGTITIGLYKLRFF